MDNRLDMLAKGIASSISRRQALGWIGAGLLSLVGFGKAWAQATSCSATASGGFCVGNPDPDCVKKCEECNKNRKVPCTDGRVKCCEVNQVCCSGQCCPAGTTCCGNKCGCPKGQTCCNGTCCDANSCIPSSSAPNSPTTCCKKEKTCGAAGALFCCPDGQRCVATTAAGVTTFACGCNKEETICANSCCKKDETCVNGVCCKTKNVCAGAPATPTSPGTPGKCCADNEVCLGGGSGNNSCCPKSCVSVSGQTVTCCPSGQTCVNGRCCTTTQICTNAAGASTCCPTGTTCTGAGTATVTCCPSAKACGNVCGCPTGTTCQNGLCV